MIYFRDGGVLMWLLLATAPIAWGWAGWYGSRGAWRDWLDVALAWIALQLGVGAMGMLMGLIMAFSAVANAAPAAKNALLEAGYKAASYPAIFSLIVAGVFVLVLVITQLLFRPQAAPRAKPTRGVLMLGGVVMAFGILLSLGSVLGVHATVLAAIQNTTPSALSSVAVNLYRGAGVTLAATPAAALYLVIRPGLLFGLGRIFPIEDNPSPHG